MAKTERVLGVVIIAGLAACMGMMVLPNGPTLAQAGTPAPEETPASQPMPVAVSEAEGSDPLTESVVRGGSLRPANRVQSVGGLSLLRSHASVDSEGAVQVGEIIGSRTLQFVGSTPAYVADFDGDSELGEGDVSEFERVWADGDARADVNGDGVVDSMDFADFVAAYDGREQRGGTQTFRLRLINGDLGEGRVQLGNVVGGEGLTRVEVTGEFQVTLDHLTLPVR